MLEADAVADETDKALSGTALQILACFLEGNEQRIADGEDGLGVLQVVFEAVVGREAGK